MTITNMTMNGTLAKAEIVSWVMDALGPGYEAAGEQLADQILAIIVKHSAVADELDLDRARLREAIAQTSASSVATTLSLLAAVRDHLR